MTVGFGKQLSGMKGVDVDGVVAIVVLHDEMSRQSDSEYRAPQTPRYFDIYNRQGNGNAGPPVQNNIETTVARIFVVGFVSAKSQFLEKILVQQPDELTAIGPARQPLPNGR